MDVINETTYSISVKQNPADKIEVEIGDSKQPDFKPQFKVMRWDNEVNFSMRAEEQPNAQVLQEDGKIKYITTDYEVHQYEKPDVSEDGGFEFEWVLNSPPSSNVLTATVQSKELSFYYQPPLTKEEIAEGAFRPDNVIGSYAVYHSSKSNNVVGGMEYKTGKAFHIYRPKAIDANGIETWCDLNIADVLLTVTVPQIFLDNATYPVTVDPTFGYTTAGAISQVNIEAGTAPLPCVMVTLEAVALSFITFIPVMYVKTDEPGAARTCTEVPYITEVAP